MPTWSSSYGKRLKDTRTVPASGRFTWSVNQSTRPIVQKEVVEATEETPLRIETFSGGQTTPTQTVDHELTVTAANLASGADLCRSTSTGRPRTTST